MKLRIIQGYKDDPNTIRLFIGAIPLCNLYYREGVENLFESIPPYYTISESLYTDNINDNWLSSKWLKFDGSKEECINHIIRLLELDNIPNNDIIIKNHEY